MQISSNHSIPGAISYPFILSEHYPFRPPQKTGGNDPESITEQMISLVLTTTRKALSQQISLSIFLAMGMNILTTPATTMTPRLWFFSILELTGQSSDSLAGHCCWLWPCRTPICSVSMWPHIDPCLVLNDLAHSLPWKFLSLHQSLGHDSMKG